MTPNQLRQSYLDFLKRQDHAVVPSASLVPENDPTTLFTGSGMQPMLPYLLGEEHPLGTRIVDSQKCFRSQDIEEVGDNRHTTFFEMLGNWSLGDYFKTEQLNWFFKWLVDEVGIEPAKLFVSVYSGNPELGIEADDEAVSLWQAIFQKHGIDATLGKNPEDDGMQNHRIFYYGDDKNWWSRVGAPANMPNGEPGGPDSEVFYDFGEDRDFHANSEWADQPCHINCDCGRFVEIGNNVFMTYIKTEAGYEPLEQKNIDFGGGFERILAAMDDQPDVFKTALFTPIISHLESVSGKSYDSSTDVQYAMRVIADHIRAGVMLATDGVLPSNKEQGYFARRLLRRSIRYGQQIGIEQSFLADLVPVVADIFAEAYPDVSDKKQTIQQAFEQEERKFQKALRKGMAELDKLEKVDEATAFMLYQTYGFPFELTQEIVAERGVTLSEEKFEQARQAHADASRSASAGKFKGGLAEHTEVTTQYHTTTHLLQAALRTVLGDHVQQQGSNITEKRLRFDFSHDQAVTQEQLSEVQELLNTWIEANLPVTKALLPKDEALASGAIAFFREKYPNEVSVYTVGANPNGTAGDIAEGWVSKELCGGPHVEATGEIPSIEIFKEQSAGAGIRRIYARIK